MNRLLRNAEGMLTHSPDAARRLLRWMLLFVLLQSSLIVAMMLRLPDTTLRNLTGSLTMCVGSFAALVTLQVGRPRAAAHLFCILNVLTAVAAALVHGVRVPALVGSFIAVAVSGYPVGFAPSLIYAVVSVVGLWMVFALQLQGRLNVVEPPVQVWGMVLIALLILTGFILAIPLRGLLRAHAILVEERRKLSESIREHEASSKGLETEVERRTEDLRVINADLERFPLALAHDLRTPLQSLSGYATLLAGNELEESRKQALERLQRAVEGFDARLNQTLHAGRDAPHG